jgi:hypothetical protein
MSLYASPVEATLVPLVAHAVNIAAKVSAARIPPLIFMPIPFRLSEA